MTDPAGAELIRRYAEANAKDDFETLEALRHPEWQETWPQSGEIVTSSANYAPPEPSAPRVRRGSSQRGPAAQATAGGARQ